MKKIIFTVSIILTLFNFSCDKDDSLDPRPVLLKGQFVYFDITDKRFNSDDLLNSRFGGILTTPGNNIALYKLYVRKFDGANPATDFKLIKEVTNFPFELKLSVQDIANALNVPSSSVKYGDVFGFYGESFSFEGKRSDYSNLSAVIQANSGSYKHAYRFNTDVYDSSGFTPLELENFNNYLGQ